MDEFAAIVTALGRRPQLDSRGMDDAVCRRATQIADCVCDMVAAIRSAAPGSQHGTAVAPPRGLIVQSGVQIQVALVLLWLHCRRIHHEPTVDSGFPGIATDRVTLVDLPAAHQRGVDDSAEESVTEWAARLSVASNAVTAQMPTTRDEPDSARRRRAGLMLVALAELQGALSAYMTAWGEDMVACTLTVLREDSAGGAGRA